ncbi:hypothetical protein M9435_006343 [Picochlorum sp. BPE23]|nr:hypothetical protein M9435_006343 [Picochlorum sp. BPE23]
MSMYAIVGKQTGSLPSAARQPTRRRNTPRRAYSPNTTLRVYAGKKNDAKNRQRGSKKPADKKKHDGWKMNSMATVKSDETMLFQPVPGNADALTVIYAYPNEYSVGITSLGYQLVYAFLEMSSLVNVTRMFTDVGDPMPRTDVDLVGFSFSWELDYSNLIDMLEGLEIPILAADRTDKHPIVFGGGPALTANPEPFAGFFDVVLLGDGEEMLSSFIRTVHDVTRDGVVGTSRRQRESILSALAACPGMYIPQFYEPVYDGMALVDIRPIHPSAQAYVEKQTYRGGTLASSTIVSPRMAWENIFMAEVVRSCPEMCRFCLASYLTLPFRAAPLEGSLIPTIEKGLQYTDRVGLLGASVTQHPEFSALLEWLMHPERSHVRLSIASVRTNTVTEELATALSSRGTRSLTIAVESGSSKVRRIVNKKLEQEDIEKAAVNAQAGGLQALKLYGMAGVPGETEHDIDQTIQMMTSLKKAAPKLKLTLGCSTFVPKAHTPFQWRGVDPAADKRLKRMDKELKKHGIQFRPESYKWSVVQALLSRGDRRMTEMLLRAKSLGDSLSTFKRAAKEVPDMPPLSHYAHDIYDDDCVLPWQHLHGPLPIDTLRKHYREAEEEIVSSQEAL